MEKVALIADDLTGAMDTGVELARRGVPTWVLLDPLAAGRFEMNAAAAVADTESRNVPEKEAAERVCAFLQAFEKARIPVIYKKIDSTLRGNLDAELRAVHGALKPDLILVAPALPGSGRTTAGGRHFVNGTPITASDLAKDPFAQVTSDRIADSLAGLAVREVGLAAVRRGAGALAETFQGCAGCEAVVADAETDRDLEILDEAAELCGLRVLRCGSAGLFKAMAARTHGAARKREWTAGHGPLLVLSGSPAQRTKDQIRRAEKSGALLLSLEDGEKAANDLKAGRSVVVDGAGSGKAELVRRFGKDREGLLKASAEVQQRLCRIAKEALPYAAGLMIVGGDTALALCRSLSARALAIESELEPMVPAGRLVGGAFDGLPVITKAGGLGGLDAIAEAVARFGA
ncbi:four-carbon acid sugar kinase family protein [Gehongia tenuis]|uniref:Four-carbon acid sugar kinase family protein n=1 Tax=Gehongia tenuis TaxID=2763655 RepID=A0A926HNL4_9FIRM|nr:four-carbon acid sugar kinase family protein [Gehongia tenuis]MBC8530283.1 four-carbon acid sugar kinase family protein [Gehongia tenuis]